MYPYYSSQFKSMISVVTQQVIFVGYEEETYVNQNNCGLVITPLQMSETQSLCQRKVY